MTNREIRYFMAELLSMECTNCFLHEQFEHNNAKNKHCDINYVQSFLDFVKKIKSLSGSIVHAN